MTIPDELKALPHWVGWRHRRRDGRMTKIPYVLGEGNRHARANDPSTWRPFDAAEAFGPQYDGIGFQLLGGGGFSAVDLDLCRDRVSGRIAPWALQIVRRFSSYTEITPSGEGLRIFCKGTLADGGWRNKRLGAARPDGHTAGCEVYSDGKYLTVTGIHLDGTPERVNEAQAALDWLQANPPSLEERPALVAHTVVDVPLSDEELIKKACASAHGDEFARLWAGDTSMHGGDDSRADAALCRRLAYWTAGDRTRVDRLFRKSGLMRPKWDEIHGAGGQTFADMTLAFVLADFAKEPPVRAPGAQAPPAEVRGGTLRELLRERLAPPRHVIPGLLQRGLMILAGKPKIGKSWLVLNLLLAVAVGGKALGRFACERGDVLYLALEDPKYRLQDRAKKLLLGADAPDGFYYFLDWPRLDQGGLEALDTWLGEHPAAALVVIDVWKRVKPPPAKGLNAYDTDYDAIVQLQKLALKRDVCIVVVHHTNKNPSDDDTDVISGSIGFTGGADGHMVMKLLAGDNAVLRGRGREVLAFNLAITFDKVAAVWSVLGDASDVQLSAERRTILDVIARTGRPMKPSEVAPLAKLASGSTRFLMWRMGQDGQLEHRDGGYYFVIEKRDDAANSANSANSPNSPNSPNREGGDAPKLLAGEGTANSPANRLDGSRQGLEEAPVSAVSAVSARARAREDDVVFASYTKCRTCGGLLVEQRRRLGECSACADRALWENAGAF